MTSAVLEGGPAVVNWFQSTCVACQAELGTFAAVADAERAKVRFLGIDVNDPSASAALAMVRRARAEYPVAQAPGVASIDLGDPLRGRGPAGDGLREPERPHPGEVLGKVPRSELFDLLGNLAAGRPLNFLERRGSRGARQRPVAFWRSPLALAWSFLAAFSSCS